MKRLRIVFLLFLSDLTEILYQAHNPRSRQG
jgi:hypothetical protein